MKYDVLFEISFDEKEKNYQKYFPDKKFNLKETENEIENITEDFNLRRIKFIGTLTEEEMKEFIESCIGYAKVEPVVAPVIGMPSFFPDLCPAIIIFDEMPYPPVEGRIMFITPIDENETEFNTLRTLIEKSEKDLIDYITDRLL